MRRIFGIIFIFLCILGCMSKTQIQETQPVAKVYPPELNFLETMHIGDTVFFFIKESGFSSDPSSPHSTSFYTFYAKQEVIRADSFEYRVLRYWALPEGHKNLYFELDTLKFKLKKAQKLFSVLESSCELASEPRYDENNKCYEIRPISRDYIGWKGFCEAGMSAPQLQDWRMNPPSHQEVKIWRESLRPEDGIWRYEVLSFLGDTCKLSYTDKRRISFMRDFP